jgi:hypothetical protein
MRITRYGDKPHLSYNSNPRFRAAKFCANLPRLMSRE